MSQRILNGTIALDRLVHVKMEKQGKNGKVKGLFIPLDANKLEEKSYETKNGKVNEIQMSVRLIVKDQTDDRGQDGFIAKALGSESYKAMSDEDKEALKDNSSELSKRLSPILGNIKDFNKSGQPQDQSNAVSDETFDENDDLPF